MSDPKKVALFVDIENVYLGLRNTYNRELSPELLIEKAKAKGEIAKAFAYADWKELPEGLADKLKPFGFETVAVERVPHSREPAGKRREVVRDLVPVEMTAGVFKTLKDEPALDTYILCTGDRAFVSAVKLARESFGKEVIVCAIPGTLAKELETAATAAETIEVAPLEPVDEEGLSKLVPLMEELERRKRYLNFKYIRESVVRHGELKAKSFDEAERLLSDAIACGLVLKQKVEDKYHPGQLFTAYALNRDSALWKKYGSGLPAPVRTEGEDGPVGLPPGAEGLPLEGALPAPTGELPATDAAAPATVPVAGPTGLEPLAPAVPSSLGAGPAVPAFASAGSGGAPEEPRERRGRRGRRGSRGDRGEPRGGDREPRDERPAEPALRGGGDRDRGDRDRDRDRRGGDRNRQGGRSGGRGPSSAKSGDGRGRPGRGAPGGGGSNRDRDFGRRSPSVPSRWEQPARRDPNAPALNDDEIDEERILRARGDL